MLGRVQNWTTPSFGMVLFQLVVVSLGVEQMVAVLPGQIGCHLFESAQDELHSLTLQVGADQHSLLVLPFPQDTKGQSHLSQSPQSLILFGVGVGEVW